MEKKKKERERKELQGWSLEKAGQCVPAFQMSTHHSYQPRPGCVCVCFFFFFYFFCSCFVFDDLMKTLRTHSFYSLSFVSLQRPSFPLRSFIISHCSTISLAQSLLFFLSFFLSFPPLFPSLGLTHSFSPPLIHSFTSSILRD